MNEKMIEALEEGNLVDVENIANGNWNEAATGAENSLMMTAILAKGAPLPEGHPYAGVYAKLDRDEEGEIELQLFDKNNTNGSAYDDLQILQTPVLEAFTNNASTMKSKLVSIPRTNLLYFTTLKINDVMSN